MAPRRKTAAQSQGQAPAHPTVELAGTPETNPVPAAAAASREPGDDTAAEASVGPRKSGWAARSTIAVPLTEEAKRDRTKGEVARYLDGYSRGVGARIDSPDPQFRPSPDVTEPLKEEHPSREPMRWNKQVFAGEEVFHKPVTGHGRGGKERNPVAERLDGEERFAEMVERRRGEIDKSGGGKTPR